MEKEHIIVLSGTIIMPKEQGHQKYPPFTKEIRLNEFYDNQTSFITTTCNSCDFFILCSKDKQLWIDAFHYTKGASQKYFKIDLENYQTLPDKRDISLFCSDNYIFFSMKYKVNNELKRTTRFATIKRENSKNKIEEGFNETITITEKAFDFCGNNDNFAFFIFNGFNPGDNNIITFSSDNDWKKKLITLVDPNDDINFYNRNYIKMGYYGNDLYLIGANQNSMRNASNFNKYLVDNNDITTSPLITNIYSIEKVGLVRILRYNKTNKEKEEVCDIIEPTTDFKIEIKKKLHGEISISDIFKYPIEYEKIDNAKTHFDWIRSKKSCIFHSIVYLKEVEFEKVQKNRLDTISIFANADKFGDPTL